MYIPRKGKMQYCRPHHKPVPHAKRTSKKTEIPYQANNNEPKANLVASRGNSIQLGFIETIFLYALSTSLPLHGQQISEHLNRTLLLKCRNMPLERSPNKQKH